MFILARIMSILADNLNFLAVGLKIVSLVQIESLCLDFCNIINALILMLISWE